MTTLNRTEHGRTKAPVRIVHLGIGNFTRAHQVWYTEHAHDADQWGIAAFTGRSPQIAETLAPSQGLYQLAVADPEGDQVEVISALSEVHSADDLAAWRGYFADPQLAIVTSTITEAGYQRNDAGDLDLDQEQLAADLAALREDPTAQVSTAPAKFVAGLLARREAGAGAITFCPCDNIPDNGPMVKRIISQAAEQVDPSLGEWIEANVGVVTTMVDRITPRTTDEDRARVAEATGIDDPALVVTEPFTEWVLSGDFVAGRPAWEDAGARFVDDVRPHEMRKLTLLNGSHSLMAYAGSIRGCETVHDAINDDICLGWVTEFWDDAVQHLEVGADELADYREALLSRYRNPRIRHLLAQIAGDGSQKVPIRAVPTIKAAFAKGKVARGATREVAAWIAHLKGHGAPVNDPRAEELAKLVAGDDESAIRAILGKLGIDEEPIRQAVREQLAELLQVEGGARPKADEPTPQEWAGSGPLVVVMGVAGCGKSTVGEELATRLGLPCRDADDFHPASNVAKMQAGTPLEDEDRWPWLAAIAEWLHERGDQGAVATCSALKRSYRDALRAGEPELFFVHLDGPKEEATRRVTGRDAHFMPGSLVDSQYEILQALEPDEGGVVVDFTAPVEEICDQVLASLKH